MSVVDGRSVTTRKAWAGREWLRPIQEDLALVEDRLQSAVSSEIDLLGKMSGRLFAAGGKRVRPVLVLLSYYATGGQGPNVQTADLAVAAELVHTASIVHDDVIDQAAERRGVPTAGSLWGNKLSVLGGDFMLARAFGILALDERGEILRALSGAASRMAESEVLQAQCEFSLDGWERDYWRIIEGKTAALMMACCVCGSLAAGAGEESITALTEFGTDFGLAFQISDDLLDIVGDPMDTGKDKGSDLADGKYTLPVIYAAQIDPRVRTAVESAADDGWTRDAREEVVRLVCDSGAVERARAAAVDRSIRACKSLSRLPESDYRASLDAVARHIASRVS